MQVDDDETGLWSGVDDTSDPAEMKERQPALDDDPMPDAEGMAVQMLRQSASTLSAGQVHALMAGFIPWIVALITGEPLLLGIATGVTVIAIGHDYLPTRFVTASVCSPTFCVGGAAIGWVVGGFILAAVEVVKTVVVVIP